MFNTKIVQFKFGKAKMNKNKIGNVENQGMWVIWQYPWTPSWIFEYPHDLDGIVYIGPAHDFHSAFPGAIIFPFSLGHPFYILEYFWQLYGKSERNLSLFSRDWNLHLFVQCRPNQDWKRLSSQRLYLAK